MFEILRKKLIGPKEYLMEVRAPRVAEKRNDHDCFSDGRRGDIQDGTA